MCVYSMVLDHVCDCWPKRVEAAKQFQDYFGLPPDPAISKQEIEEFRRLLERAREYDRKNNEPDCELEEKKETLRRLAKQLGVEINFL